MDIKLLKELQDSDVSGVKKLVYFEFEDGNFSGDLDTDIIKLYKLNKEICEKDEEFRFVHNVIIEQVPIKICIVTAPTNVYKSINIAVKSIASFMTSADVSDVIIDLSKNCLDEDVMRKLVEGLYIALYRFDDYKSTKKNSVENIYMLANADDNIIAGFEEGAALGKATCIAKQLVNEPANVMLPERIADEAVKVGKEYGFDVTVYEKDEIEKIHMPAYLEVAKASDNEPRLIVMEYKGNPDNADKVLGLVGKGLSFDTGGYSLKPPTGMLSMKTDMGGSAAVIGAMAAIAAQQLTINVTAVVASCENMVSGKGYRPGDIINSRGGKTIFVKSTDAEGRFTLIDAITYIQRKENVTKIVDMATLTGAAIVCLGNAAAVTVSNNDDFYNSYQKAAVAADEKIWRMPIFKEYKEQLKSKVADYTNTPGNPGSVTAGMLLQEFVEEEKPWIHVDIAPVAFHTKKVGYYSEGASGYGAISLFELAKSEQK